MYIYVCVCVCVYKVRPGDKCMYVKYNIYTHYLGPTVILMYCVLTIVGRTKLNVGPTVILMYCILTMVGRTKLNFAVSLSLTDLSKPGIR